MPFNQLKKMMGMPDRPEDVPMDQLYANPIGDIDPNKPPQLHGMKEGGVMAPAIDPLDFIAPTGAAKSLGFLGRELGAIAPQMAEKKIAQKLAQKAANKNPLGLPDEMSLIDRIKIAKQNSGNIRQVPTFEQQANAEQLEKWKSQGKNFFEKARNKATDALFEEVKKKLEQNKQKP